MVFSNEEYNTLSPTDAKSLLIRLLQNAHAGERAAANAYWGHGHSLFVTNTIEKQEIKKIYLDELHHRARLKEMLTELGATPRLTREILMYAIGSVICVLCLFGGWFIPMYGAGKLESTNIVEYEVAARLAYLAGYKHYVSELLEFAEIEWDHELYFFNKTASHSLYTYAPKWVRPPERESIRGNFQNHFERR